MGIFYEGAEVTKRRGLAMQVCVPTGWTDEEVLQFASISNPCGTMNGWQIRRQGHEALKGDDERVDCHDREGFVHIMLDA